MNEIITDDELASLECPRVEKQLIKWNDIILNILENVNVQHLFTDYLPFNNESIGTQLTFLSLGSKCFTYITLSCH